MKQEDEKIVRENEHRAENECNEVINNLKSKLILGLQSGKINDEEEKINGKPFIYSTNT